MRKEYFNSLKYIFSIAIIAFLIYKTGISSIYSIFKSFNFVYLLIILPLFAIVMLLGVVNIKVLMIPLNREIKFIKLIKYYLLSWSMGLFAPGKVGEFSIAYFLKKHDVHIGEGFALSLIDKLLTFVCLFLLSIFGFFIFLDKKVVLLIILTVSILLILFITSFYFDRSRNTLRKILPNIILINLKGFSKLFKNYLRNHKLLLFTNFMITFLKWIISFIITYFAFSAYNLNVPLITIIIIGSITKIVSMIPISISGLGIKEGTAVYLFGKYGFDQSIVLITYLTLTIINYLTAIMTLLSIKKEDI